MHRANPAASLRSIAVRALLLAVLGSAAGLAANALRRDERVPWRHDWSRDVEVRAAQEGFALVSLAELKAALERGDAVLLDARPLRDYDAGHIPGAMPLPSGEFEAFFAPLQGFLSAGQPLILYCSGSACDDSLVLARQLKSLGYTELSLFAGGYAAWQAGHPEARP